MVYQYRRLSNSHAPRRWALSPPWPYSLHVVGKDRIEQQRHMAEQVVKDVRLDDVVELLRRANPVRDRESAIGQQREEGHFRNQAGHRHDFPARCPVQALVDFLEARNAVLRAQRGQRARGIRRTPGRGPAPPAARTDGGRCRGLSPCSRRSSGCRCSRRRRANSRRAAGVRWRHRRRVRRPWDRLRPAAWFPARRGASGPARCSRTAP